MTVSDQQVLFEGLDPTARHDEDFYATPRMQLEMLISRLSFRPAIVIEPCAGDGAIVKPLRELGARVWANDIVDRGFPLDSQLDATRRDFWAMVDEHFCEPIVAITNLPFNTALPILEQAVRFCCVVCTILRRTFDEPTEERNEWLAANPTAGQIVMPRYQYRRNGSTDSTTTAWFIWSSIPNVVKPHDVVTLAERDRLIAKYGDR
jgi:hypothetical protein